MKYFTLLFLICISNLLKAQFAIVETKDGLVNVREKAGPKSHIKQKLPNGAIVMVDEIEYSPEQTWFYVKFDDKKSGYIHKSGLKFIHSFTKGYVNFSSENSIRILAKECELKISTQNFIAENYEITYEKNQTHQSEDVLKIDGKEFWGTDFSLPQKAYLFMNLKLANQSIHLLTENLFNPNLKATSLYLNPKNNSIYIIANNGDGAGAYSVIWVIKNGKFEKRMVILTA
jgi:hypothetical protein